MTTKEKIGPYKVHPVAALFPLLEPGSRAYMELSESIAYNGQIDPIVVDGDVLLDGRNRLSVLIERGIAPTVIQWSALAVPKCLKKLSMATGQPMRQADWILEKNIQRRNLSQDQRVAIVSEFEAWDRANDSAEAKAKAQFKEGDDERRNAGGKAVVRTESCEPVRDHAKEHARSTVGRIAASAGVSHHKAAQAVKLAKAAATDPQAAEDLQSVKAGLKKLKDVSAKPKTERPVPPLRERVVKEFQKFMDKFAVADHPEVLEIIMEEAK